ncbi:MAG TPA: glycosyltransferase [Candidatus Binatia bacterium]|nr:glycosyltransferase [Candidatus Binatia bacterium]
MRILLASDSYLPYLSGVTVSVDALARGLGARGHDVLVLAPRPASGALVGGAGSPGPEPAYAWLASYELHRLVPPGYRMPWPNPAAGAVRDVRRFRPQIVHAHSPFVTGLLARRAAREAGVPLVFTHHTRFDDYGHYLGPFARPGMRLLDAHLRRFWARCAAVIAPSQDLGREIRARMRRARVEVIPTGVAVGAIRALAPVDPRPTADWPPDAIVVASLGRLAPEKSPMLLLEAISVAAERVPELRALVIGGGPAEGALRLRAAAPDLAGRVAFSGPLPRMEALARLAGADLFAFASRTETQGLVLAEALAAGLPAVAVDGPGVRDSVRDGVDGVVVAAEPATDRGERLGAAIGTIAADVDARHVMAERAHDDADRFAVERRVEEVEALYRSLRG